MELFLSSAASPEVTQNTEKGQWQEFAEKKIVETLTKIWTCPSSKMIYQANVKIELLALESEEEGQGPWRHLVYRSNSHQHASPHVFKVDLEVGKKIQNRYRDVSMAKSKNKLKLI